MNTGGSHRISGRWFCTSRCGRCSTTSGAHVTHFNTPSLRFPDSDPRPAAGGGGCRGSRGREAPAPGRRGRGRARKAQLGSAGFVSVCSRCLGPRPCRARSGGRRVRVSRGRAEARRGRAGTRRLLGSCRSQGGAGAGWGMSARGRGQCPGLRPNGSAAWRALPALMGSGTSASVLLSYQRRRKGTGKVRGEGRRLPTRKWICTKMPRTPPGAKSLPLPATAAGQGSGEGPRRVTGGQEKSGQQNLRPRRCS